MVWEVMCQARPCMGNLFWENIGEHTGEYLRHDLKQHIPGQKTTGLRKKMTNNEYSSGLKVSTFLR